MPLVNFPMERLVQPLRLADLLMLQATDMSTRTMCLEGSVWPEAIMQEFSDFDLPPSLLKPSGWRSIAPLFREIRRSQLSIDSKARLQFKEVAQVEWLATMLNAARRQVHPAPAYGLNPGHVSLGRMRFPKGLPIAEALQDDSHQIYVTREGPPLCIGETIIMRTRLLDNIATDAGFETGSISNIVALTLHFGLHGGRLHVALSDKGLPPSNIMAPERLMELYNRMHLGSVVTMDMITLDITVCSLALTLNHRSVDVAVNGPWTTCRSGVFAMTSGRAAGIEALWDGVPCVVRARPRPPSNQRRLRGRFRAIDLDTPGVRLRNSVRAT